MARLIIEGDKRQLEIIATRNRLRKSKNGLEISMEEEKKETKQEKPVKKAAKSK